MITLQKDPKFEPMMKKAMDKKTYEKMLKELTEEIYTNVKEYTGSIFGTKSWMLRLIKKSTNLSDLTSQIDTNKRLDIYFTGGMRYAKMEIGNQGKFFLSKLGEGKKKKFKALTKRQFFAPYKAGRLLIIERVSKTVTIARYMGYDRLKITNKWKIKQQFEESFAKNSAKIISSYPGRIL